MKKMISFILLFVIVGSVWAFYEWPRKQNYRDVSVEEMMLIAEVVTNITQVEPVKDSTLLDNSQHDEYYLRYNWEARGVQIGLVFMKGNPPMPNYCAVEYANKNRKVINPITAILQAKGKVSKY